MISNRLMLEAIALRKCVAARYNRSSFRLAPHILYTRHGEPFVDAVAIECDGRPPREPKIGTFKLSGLQDLELTDRTFEPYEAFEATDPKYEGVALFSVLPA